MPSAQLQPTELSGTVAEGILYRSDGLGAGHKDCECADATLTLFSKNAVDSAIQNVLTHDAMRYEGTLAR